MAGRRNALIRRWTATVMLIGSAAAGAAVLPGPSQAGPSNPVRPPATTVMVGETHACAAVQGKAYCWGDNQRGQLGDGSTTASFVAVPVSTTGVMSGRKVASLSVNQNHTCATETFGKAYCWGENSDGQLGDGTTTDSSVPVLIPVSGVLAGKKLVQVATGRSHTCALDVDGMAYCWGSNGNGQLGDNSMTDSPSPVAVDTSGALAGKTLVAITAGGSVSCALDSAGTAYCWGTNSRGAQGDGVGSGNNLVPTPVDTSGVLAGKTLVAVSTAYTHSCVLDSAGKAYCWGRNSDKSQLGDGSSTNRSSPAAVDTGGVLAGKTLRTLAAGGYTTCAVDTADAVFCWGEGRAGKRGDGTTTTSGTATTWVRSGLPASFVAARAVPGLNNTCFQAATGRTYCVGTGEFGALGDSTSAVRLAPTDKVVPMPTVPTAPLALAATGGNGQAGLTFTPPADDADGIDHYEVSTDGGTTWQTTSTSPGTGGTRTATVTSLTNGVQYSFLVRAVSTGGLGLTSGPATATPVGPQPAAVAGVSSIAVSWQPPADTTGLVDYTVIAAPGPSTCKTTATSCVLGGVAGTSYTVTVVATFTGGRTETSEPSVAVTPTAPQPPADPPATGDSLTTDKGRISTARPGQQITFIGTGFAAHSTVVVTIYSEPTVLGTVVTDEFGNFSVPIVVPADLADGQHTVVAQGTAPNGTARAMRLAVTVGGLAVTGSDVTGTAWAGLALLLAGGALVAVSAWYRRRRA